MKLLSNAIEGTRNNDLFKGDWCIQEKFPDDLYSLLSLAAVGVCILKQRYQIKLNNLFGTYNSFLGMLVELRNCI